MSFIKDHISKVGGQLDRLQLVKQRSAPSLPELYSASDKLEPPESNRSSSGSDIARISLLQVAIRNLSASSSPRTILPPFTILDNLEHAGLLGPLNRNDAQLSTHEHDLQWLVVSKAATQTYGLIMHTVLEQTIRLSSDIAYWDEVIGSYLCTSLYTVQTSPLRLWAWAHDIYSDAWRRLQSVESASKNKGEAPSPSLSDRWRQFHRSVKNSLHDRSIANMQSKLLSPLTRGRIEAQRKRSHLRRLRELSASGLGMLMDEGLVFGAEDEGSIISKDRSNSTDEWKSVVSKSITLIDLVVRNVTALELGVGDMEETVFQSLDDDAESAHLESASSQTVRLAARLKNILESHMPTHVAVTTEITQEYGRPSLFIRYWLPGLALFLSSSTLLRIFFNRKAEIIAWIRDFGSTTLDFWTNWVVEPTRKVVGTIRHDKDSEIAILSKASLQGDRASLERMVVAFATDHPNTTTGAPLTDTEIADVRAKVREGDLTPVLRAYERDLRNPFVGTIKGDLIRALLIQIQKTKVDVEVAVGGIDDLLKSQELVFGFVGLTPGILVCLGLSRWLSGAFAGRKGRTQDTSQGSVIRILRNIDRILIGCAPSENGILSYKDHGMLLCEAHILRQRVQHSLPEVINNDFVEDVNDLIDLRTGVERQLRALERIRWAYSRCLP